MFVNQVNRGDTYVALDTVVDSKRQTKANK